MTRQHLVQTSPLTSCPSICSGKSRRSVQQTTHISMYASHRYHAYTSGTYFDPFSPNSLNVVFYTLECHVYPILYVLTSLVVSANTSMRQASYYLVIVTTMFCIVGSDMPKERVLSSRKRILKLSNATEICRLKPPRSKFSKALRSMS